MRVGSLFSGIGGLDLAARWAGWETVWFSEIDPFCNKVLAKHWPDVPNLGDIHTIHNPPPVDLLMGGFPCQDLTTSGKRKGILGERSGLWFEFERIIGESRPRYVLIENVPGLLTAGFEYVLQGLRSFGYDAEWTPLSASALGAYHRRERLWVVAYPVRDGSPSGLAGSKQRQEGFAGIFDNGGLAGGGDCPGRGLDEGITGTYHWESEPGVGRVAHGLSGRVDRLRGLGNAVVPQCAYYIMQHINRREALNAGIRR